jgi:hypothetical protein
MVLKVLLVQLVLREKQVLLVLQVQTLLSLVHKDLKEKQVLLVLKVSKVKLVLKVLLAKAECQFPHMMLSAVSL